MLTLMDTPAHGKSCHSDSGQNNYNSISTSYTHRERIILQSYNKIHLYLKAHNTSDSFKSKANKWSSTHVLVNFWSWLLSSTNQYIVLTLCRKVKTKTTMFHLSTYVVSVPNYSPFCKHFWYKIIYLYIIINFHLKQAKERRQLLQIANFIHNLYTFFFISKDQ